MFQTGSESGAIMEKVQGIGGMFFRAKDPDALRKWYDQTLGVSDFMKKPWVQEQGETVFSPFNEDIDYFDRPSQQWMINFRVANLERMVAQLTSLGIEVRQDPEWGGEYGKFARIHDPEGNPIELWEPPEAS